MPQPLTIPHVLKDIAQRFPDYMAIVDGETRLSYADLDKAREHSAAAFLSLGIEKGDRVGLLAPNMAEWIIVALGLHSVGGVLLPINTRFKGREIAGILNQSHARFLVLVDAYLGNDYSAMLDGKTMPYLEKTIVLSGDAQSQAKDHQKTIPWETLLKEGEPFLPQAREALSSLSPDDLSDMVFTSGTTGSPKGVMCTHRKTVETYNIYSQTLGLCEKDRYLVVPPFFHSFGYKAGWVSCLIRGSCIYPWKEAFNAEKVLSFVKEHKITTLPGTPAIFQSFFLLDDFVNEDLASIQIICIGGEMVPESVVERLEQCGCETLLKGYGLTETSGIVSLSRKGDSIRKIVKTCGVPIDGLSVECRGEDGKSLSVKEEGEIFVKGFNVMTGYYQNPEETGKVLDDDGWLATGDIGFLDAEGYLTVCDRKKDVIIVGGLNCYPLEVEACLLEHPDIAEAAVLKKADQRLGEVPQAFIVLTKNASEQEDEEREKALMAWVKERIANFKVPRAFTVLKELPRTPVGKVKKFVLAKMGK